MRVDWTRTRLSCCLLLEPASTPSKVLQHFSFFLSYSFGIETVNTFIHSRSSLENHTRFQTKMGKVYTRFQTKTAQNPHPMGRHILGLHQGVNPPPPSPPRDVVWHFGLTQLFLSNFVLFTCMCTHNLWKDKVWSSPGTSIGKTKHTSYRAILSRYETCFPT